MSMLLPEVRLACDITTGGGVARLYAFLPSPFLPISPYPATPAEVVLIVLVLGVS